MADWIEQLERLTALNKDGALTDQEFAQQKALVFERRDSGLTLPEAAYAEPQVADHGGSGFDIKWLIAGLAFAVLAGFLIWTWLVDRNGTIAQNDPAIEASAKAAPVQPATGAATTAAASDASTFAAMPSAAGGSDAAITMANVPPASVPPARVTYNPSFSCAGQRANVLVMICEDRNLAAKDRDLSERFRDLLADQTPDGRTEMLKRQRAFLKDRDACLDRPCLNRWYDRTIAFYYDE
jgi:hypothetical protein